MLHVDGHDKLIEFFYKNAIDTSSDDESYSDSKLMMAAATLIHEHSERKRHVHKGSTRPRRGNINRHREVDHYRL
jgi:hypothetical protein